MALSNVARQNFNCEFHRESEKTVLYLKHLKENDRPTAYRVCLRTRHHPDYLVDPVCALVTQLNQKSAD
jgi:hypothetical protein